MRREQNRTFGRALFGALAAALTLTACGGGGGSASNDLADDGVGGDAGSVDPGSEGRSSDWDALLWDEGNWA